MIYHDRQIIQTPKINHCSQNLRIIQKNFQQNFLYKYF